MQIPSILVIDDDQDVLSVIEFMLDDLGYPSIAKLDPLAALDFVKTGAPISLVITDYQMPGMNGADFVQALKQLTPDVPVIMLTGYGMGAFTTVPGVFKYVKKPIERRTLHEIIKTALAQP